MGNQNYSTIHDSVMRMQALRGFRYNEDQQAVFNHGPKTAIIAANPGAGKTEVFVGAAQLYTTHYGIPGSKINIMSFTNEATGNINKRYATACDKTYMRPTAKFNTFHAICRAIVDDFLPGLKVVKSPDIAVSVEKIKDYALELGYEFGSDYEAKDTFNAIIKLNSTLMFDEGSVTRSSHFKKTKMPYSVFTEVRRKWFARMVIMKVIPQGDLPIVALYAILLSTNLRKKYKDMYHLMMVDESQDMSALYLKILSLLSDELIIIADPKQAIYGFNGASNDIVGLMKRMYPEAPVFEIQDTFRCGQEIADIATKVINPTFPDVKPFNCLGRTSKVNITNSDNLDISTIVDGIVEDMRVNTGDDATDIMFLYRNKYSCAPILEELYNKGVTFRVRNLPTVLDMPFISDLITIVEYALDPLNIDRLRALLLLMPEFKKTAYSTRNPIVLAVKDMKKGLHEIPYRFTDNSSLDFVRAISQTIVRVDEEKPASVVLGSLVPIYDKHIIRNKFWILESDKEYYQKLARGIIGNKTYPELIDIEYDKLKKNDQAIAAGMGVRLSTIHSAKGAEADVVYIMDASAGVFPSDKEIKNLLALDCAWEAANLVVSDRNLLYVALTRAKKEVNVIYDNELTPLIASPEMNQYSHLDLVYHEEIKDYDEIGAFLKTMRLGEPDDDN